MGSWIDGGGAMPICEAEMLSDDDGPKPRSLASASLASWTVVIAVGAAVARAFKAEYRSSLEAMIDVFVGVMAAAVPERDINPIPEARSFVGCMGVVCIIDIIGLLLLLLLLLL